jgi:hypothetical protein
MLPLLRMQPDAGDDGQRTLGYTSIDFLGSLDGLGGRRRFLPERR